MKNNFNVINPFLGCQDPWHVNPRVPLQACTNVTYIRASYSQGPESESYGAWDGLFWDRHYLAERELAEISRNGKGCHRPCTQTYYKLDQIQTTSKDK